QVIVDIDGVHLARRTDRVGEAEREVTAAGTEVSDSSARPESESGDDRIGALPTVAPEALVHPALDRCTDLAGETLHARRSSTAPTCRVNGSIAGRRRCGTRWERVPPGSPRARNASRPPRSTPQRGVCRPRLWSVRLRFGQRQLRAELPVSR